MNQQEIILRNETPEDYRAVEELTREAFWNQYIPGCDEHYLVHLMRSAEAFVPELDFVAELDGQIVGHIVYADAMVVDDGEHCHRVLSFGPLSVLPSLQGKGIGSLLVEHTKRIATILGYKAILIYGDPNYYQKFGFVPAESLSIGTCDDRYADALQALELYPGALEEVSGRFCADSVYDLDLSAAAEFDLEFAPKEKLEGLPSQKRFQELLQLRRQRA